MGKYNAKQDVKGKTQNPLWIKWYLSVVVYLSL